MSGKSKNRCMFSYYVKHQYDQINFVDYFTGFKRNKQNLYKTLNQGNTWRCILEYEAYQIVSFHFVSQYYGVVLITNNRHTKIIKTRDGGRTWEDHSEIPSVYHKVFLIDQDTVLLIGKGQIFLLCDDKIYPILFPFFYNEISAIDTYSSTEWIFCIDQSLYFSKDAGITWQAILPNETIVHVMQHEDHTFAFNHKKLFIRYENSSDWVELAFPENNILHSFYIKNRSEFYMMSENKYCFYTNNGGLDWIKIGLNRMGLPLKSYISSMVKTGVY